MLLCLILIVSIFSGLTKHNLLYVGESINLDASKIKKITVSNSKVIKVEKLKNNRIIIKAKRKGSSSVHFRYKDFNVKSYHFNVMSSSVYRRLSAVKGTLSKLDNVKVKVAGEYLYITGFVDDKDSLEIVRKVSRTHKKNINLVKLSDKSLNLRENEIYNNLLKLNLRNISYKNIDNMCFISGVCKNQIEEETLKKYISQTIPNCYINISILPYQVDLNIKIIETSKNILNEFGLEMPETYDLNRKTVLSNIEIDSILHINKNNGKIKTLASPALTSNNNEKAVFHVGGEFPVKLSTKYSSNLTWKQYGVILIFTPNVINENTLTIKIESEFSSLDDSKTIDKLPGISKKNVNTIVTVETGKSLMISGLIKKSSSDFEKSYPLIRYIPILSSLFSFQRSSKEKTELAMIVTPNIRYWGEEKELFRKLDELFEEVYKI